MSLPNNIEKNSIFLNNNVIHYIFVFSGIEAEQVSSCFGVSLGLSIGKADITGKVTLSHSECQQKGALQTGMKFSN